jgi:hypothetical protein
MILLDGKLHILHRFNDLFVGVQEKSRIAADKLTDSINKQIDALRRQQDAEDRRKASRYSVARAEIAVERARQDVARVEDQINKGELKGRDAELARREASIALKQAKLDEKQAREDLTAAKKDENKADQDAVSKSKGAVDSARGRIDALKDERQVLTERRDEAQRNVDADKQITTDWTLSVEQRQRAMIRLKDDEKVLQDAQDDLNENTRNLRHEGDRSVDAWKRYRKAVRDAGKSTDTFGNIVDDTMDSIVRDVNDVLVEFGAKPLRWKSTRRRSSVERESGASEIFGTPDIGGFPGRQGGGFAVPGHGTGDSVYMQAKVEPGEKVFVLNRNASRVLDGLHSLNRFIPRFAAGGEINWNGHPTNVSAAVKSMLSRLFTRWPDLLVTSTTDHSRLTTSGNVSDHAGGNAVDVASGDYGYMLRVAEWIKSSGLYRSLKQGIHNPNLAVNAGRLQRPPGQFAGAVWAQHANHIHLAIMGTIGRLLGSVAQRVISGPPGRLTDALRGISRRVVRAANSFISRQTSDSTSDENYAGLPTGGDGSKLMRSIARARGWNFGDWWALDASETGHGRNLSNPNSTARLRGQFLNFNWGKYGPGSDPRQSPSMAQQIQAMARYIAERYGNPTAAWAFHRAHNFYAKGGEVAGRLGQAVPIVAHAKEWVVNPAQQGRLATWLGTSISGLKGALGFSGGRGSYAGGGEVQPYQIPARARDRQRRHRARAGPRDASHLRPAVAPDQLEVHGRPQPQLRGRRRQRRAARPALRVGGEPHHQARRQPQARDAPDHQGRSRHPAAQRRPGDRADDRQPSGRLRQPQQRAGGRPETARRRRQAAQGARSQHRRARLPTGRREEPPRPSDHDQVGRGGQPPVAVRGRRERHPGTRRGVPEALRGPDARARPPDPLEGHRRRDRVGPAGAAVADADRRDSGGGAQDAGRRRRERGALRPSVPGHKDTADALFAQVAELNQQAVEAVAQGLRDTTSEIEARFGRETNRIALAGRVADLRERLGDVTGAFAQRGANLVDTGTYIRGQIGELSGLLGRAQAGGQTAVAEELRDKIAELNQQLAENEVAIRENTSAARSAAIGAITQRQGFLGGVYSGVTGIVNALGEASGTTDTGSLRQILTTAGGTLAGTGSRLLQKLSEGFGVDLRGQSPQELATSLLGLDYDRIDARLIPADRSTFHDLINSIIENTTATVTNSKQLSDLNDTTTSPQSFSSSFWRVFRRAIFNGEGGLLTQFSEAIPSMAGGGSVLRGGMVNVHAGERIVAAQVVRDGADGDTYITNNITTPTEVLDPTDAARQMAHSYRNRIKR